MYDIEKKKFTAQGYIINEIPGYHIANTKVVIIVEILKHLKLL